MKAAEHVRVNLTDDGLVLLDIAQGQIFTANAIGARIWQSIVVDNKSKEEVVDSILKDWESAPEIVAADLEEFIGKLRQQALVVDA